MNTTQDDLYFKKKLIHNQRGLAVMVLVFMIAILSTALVLKGISKVHLQSDKNKQTQKALVEAKAALLSYAAAVDLTSTSCGSDCKRPGDLPCPDTNNDGISNTPCAANAIGRLPWQTLGIADLRDGDNERLWYAVSTNFKNNPRSGDLNSNSIGSISLRNLTGAVLNDGTATNGLVAIILAPGARLIREDNVVQVRESIAEKNDPTNYLDIAINLGEDNRDFVNNQTNGFILGPISDSEGKPIVNDQLTIISIEDMLAVMETRVLSEVKNALLDYYCKADGVADYSAGTCADNTLSHTFPFAASFSDSTCLGSNVLTSPDCSPSALTHGRIPANPTPDWTSVSLFSILRSTSNNNWFQQNGWREVIHYAVSSTCVTGSLNCEILDGQLTLSNATITPENKKKLILIATGKTIEAENRSSAANKLMENNYLEGENLLPLDNIYIRTNPLTSSINDRAISLP